MLAKLLKTHILKASLQKMLVNLNIQELGTAQFTVKQKPTQKYGQKHTDKQNQYTYTSLPMNTPYIFPNMHIIKI